MKKREFLRLTLREFQILNNLWAEDQLFFSKTIYESMRLQTYFTFSLQVAKKYKKNYTQFCKQYMPFSWDKVDPKDIEDQKKLENLTSEDWAEKDRLHAERMKGPTKKASAAELEL